MIPSKPEIAIEVARIQRAFEDLAPDEMISYDRLNQLVGYDVVKGNRYVLMRAKVKFEKESGQRLEAVRGEGIRKLSAENLPGIGMVSRKRIGRIAKKDHARLTDLRGYNNISPRLRARLDAEQSLLGAISAVASTKGDSIAAYTKTGPMVAAQIFEHLRPRVEETE